MKEEMIACLIVVASASRIALTSHSKQQQQHRNKRTNGQAGKGKGEGEKNIKKKETKSNRCWEYQVSRHTQLDANGPPNCYYYYR